MSTGDEVVPPDDARRCARARSGTRPPSALAGLVTGAGRRAGAAGHRPRRRRRAGGGAARRAGRAATSWWSRPGPRSVPGTRPPAWWPGSATRGSCATGWRVRPGKPTLLAECGGVPVIGLPGNPLSALVVFRLVGLPVVAGRRRTTAARRSRPCGPGWTARCRPQPAGWTSSGPGRRRTAGGQPAVRRLGAAVGADVGRRLAGRARGRPPGCPPAAEVDVRCTDSVDSRDGQPVRHATSRPSAAPRGLAAAPWRQPAARRGSRRSRSGVAEALGRVTAEPRSGPAARRRLRRRRHGRHRGARGRHLRREREHARCCSRPGDFEVVDTGDPMPPGRDAVVMREDVHRTPAGGPSCGPPPRRGRTSGRSARTSRPAELLLPAGHRLRPFDLAAAAAAGVDRTSWCGGAAGGASCRPATRSGRSARRSAPGEIPDTNSLMLAAPGPRGRAAR